MALYPPIMASSQDAFLASSPYQSIYFTLSNLTNIQDIGHIQIKVVFQTNNKSASSKYPDGILYKSSSQIQSYGNNLYSIDIQSGDLTSGWKANTYYKVQICFGENALWSGGDSNFADWKADQVLGGYFSEWSTVMVLKAINTPEIRITNQEVITSSLQDSSLVTDSSIYTELTTAPLFQGYFECSGEVEDKYRFEISYNNEVLESSGWLQHDSSSSLSSTRGIFTDSYRFSHVLTNFETYTVTYEVTTLNGYTSKAEDYTFMVNENFLTQLSGISLIVEDAAAQIERNEEPYGDENGVLNVYLNTLDDIPLSGNYVLTRSSEKSNYGVWEDIKYFAFSGRIFKKELIYQDFTIESGIGYKYAFQQENTAGLRTTPLYESTSLASSPERISNFQYSYLFADGVQLRLKFDNKMSSFKKTVLANKQDTLGSRYPTINRNGDAYYSEFPITGLISLQADDDQTFFTLGSDGYYYKDEKVIRDDKYIYAKDNDINTFNLDLTDNNIFIERIFREKVEAFLNNGECKLYKSPTEGNIVVVLMNVSLTPNETLGRMIFSFSATAYEVLENTIENLNEYNIIDIGSFQENIMGVDESGQQRYTLLLGQISGLFGTNTNLVDVIKQENEYDIGGGYQYKFQRLASIQIEAYPQIEFTNELNELQAKYIQAKNDEDSSLMSSLSKQIAELQQLEAAANKQVEYPIVTVYLNGKEISLGANRIYQLKDSEVVTSLYLKYDEPVIVNYTCYVSSEEAEQSIISTITTSNVWGQLAGVFTTTQRVLNNYQLVRPSDTFLVSDSNNYALYQSLDIAEVIKETVRHYVEEQYDTTFEYDEETGVWTDGKRNYIFQNFLTIDIEADETTSLLLTNKTDGVQQEILIGKSNKYHLEDLDGLMTSIILAKPAFLIVNYRCSTMQLTMGGELNV